MTTLARLGAATVLVLATAACAPAGANPSDGPAPSSRTTVQVTNHNWSDMVLYVVRAGMRQRLGTVPSMSTRHLEVPNGMISGGGSVLLLADPIGSREQFNTGRIMVSPGQRIALQLENHLPLSNYSVWDR